MIIEGKRIRLRAIEKEDLGKIHDWMQDPEIGAGLGDVVTPASLSQQEKWFERIDSDRETFRWAVESADGVLIGYSGLWEIHWKDRRAEHAAIIGEQAYRRKGYGRETIATCARYAFDELDLYRLDATIVNCNAASLQAYESCGFMKEGQLRAHARRNGKRHDRIMLGLLSEEYRLWCEETQFWDGQ